MLGNYLSLYLFEDALQEAKQNTEAVPQPAPKKSNSIFNLLVYSEHSDFSDINSNRELLNWMQRTYPQVKLTVFGNVPAWKNK